MNSSIFYIFIYLFGEAGVVNRIFVTKVIVKTQKKELFNSDITIWTFFQVQANDNKEIEQSYDLRNTLKVPVRLKTFVELAMDVASASPRRYFFEVRHGMSEFLICSYVYIPWHCLINIFCCCLCMCLDFTDASCVHLFFAAWGIACYAWSPHIVVIW